MTEPNAAADAGLGKRLMLVVGLSCLYMVAEHLVTVMHVPPRLAAAVLLAPWLIGFGLMLARQRPRWLAALIAVAALGGLAALWPALERNFTIIGLLQYVGTFGLLAWGFARSLGPGEEAMCSRFARIAHNGLTPSLADYTRVVTKVWTVFFILMAATSILLYLVADRVVWSTFSYLLSMPISLALFGIEFLVRIRLQPDAAADGIFKSLITVARNLGARNPGAASNQVR